MGGWGDSWGGGSSGGGGGGEGVELVTSDGATDVTNTKILRFDGNALTVEDLGDGLAAVVDHPTLELRDQEENFAGYIGTIVCGPGIVISEPEEGVAELTIESGAEGGGIELANGESLPGITKLTIGEGLLLEKNEDAGHATVSVAQRGVLEHFVVSEEFLVVEDQLLDASLLVTSLFEPYQKPVAVQAHLTIGSSVEEDFDIEPELVVVNGSDTVLAVLDKRKITVPSDSFGRVDLFGYIPAEGIPGLVEAEGEPSFQVLTKVRLPFAGKEFVVLPNDDNNFFASFGFSQDLNG